MSTIGYGDLVPKTRGGRLLALVWILVTMGITASLTATLTSLLRVNAELQPRRFPTDLRRMAIGAVADADAAHYLSQERIRLLIEISEEDWQRAIDRYIPQ